MEKSDLMRALMDKLLRKEPKTDKPSNESKNNTELKDHIFESNQSFQVVRKRIVRKK